MAEEMDFETTTIAETASYVAWMAEEPDGEVTYHVEFGPMTLHFFREEWEEFLELVQQLF
jgi:hypothetical protein